MVLIYIYDSERDRNAGSGGGRGKLPLKPYSDAQKRKERDVHTFVWSCPDTLLLTLII